MLLNQDNDGSSELSGIVAQEAGALFSSMFKLSPQQAQESYGGVLKAASYLCGYDEPTLVNLIKIMEEEESHDDCGWYMLDSLLMRNKINYELFKSLALKHSDYGVSCYAYCESCNATGELKDELLSKLFESDDSQVINFLIEVDEKTSQDLKDKIKAKDLSKFHISLPNLKNILE